MASLAGKTIQSTYKDLLQVSNSNSGVDGSLKTVEDGEGTSSALSISTSGVKSSGTLEVIGVSTLSNNLIVNGSIDLSGDIDVDGTLEADAITVNGATLASVIQGTTVTNATNATNSTNATTAANVTTNANLTGHVTSVGNSAVLGSFTLAQLNSALSDATLGGSINIAEGDVPNLPASKITSGTFADARIAASNVTQHQASLSIGASQVGSGTFANARIAASNVTQHAVAKTGGTFTGNVRIGSSFGTDTTPYDSNSDSANADFLTIKGKSTTNDKAILELASGNISVNDIIAEIHFVNRSSFPDFNPKQRIVGHYGEGLQIYTKNSNNAEVLGLQVNNLAQVKLGAYGSGTYTGTTSRLLAVNSSGDIIEKPQHLEINHTTYTPTGYYKVLHRGEFIQCFNHNIPDGGATNINNWYRMPWNSRDDTGSEGTNGYASSDDPQGRYRFLCPYSSMRLVSFIIKPTQNTFNSYAGNPTITVQFNYKQPIDATTGNPNISQSSTFTFQAGTTAPTGVGEQPALVYNRDIDNNSEMTALQSFNLGWEILLTFKFDTLLSGNNSWLATSVWSCSL